MDLKGLKVKAIIYPYAKYRLGISVHVIDEGSFYRIDETRIFDKHKIKDVRGMDERAEIEMADKKAILEI